MRRTALSSSLLAAVLSTGVMAQSNTVKMAESSIRRVATAKPAPAYPATSLQQKRSGVAVARIASHPDGRMATVTVLEAPDDATGAAMQAALMTWVIPPVTVAGRSEQHGVTGKVTFYFRVEKGQGRVFSPEEMPGGPMPEPASGPPARGPGAGPPSARAGAPAPAIVSHSVAPDVEIDDAELKRLMATEKPTLLDIRERDDFKRDHHPAALNIPRDELTARAGIELDSKRPLVIDCSRTETQDCRNAASSLIRAKRYPTVLIYLP